MTDIAAPLLQHRIARGDVRLGLTHGYSWHTDPKHLGFALARYKFVAKMLAGKGSVLEVGCGDAFCLSVVAQTVGRVIGIDNSEILVDDAKARGVSDIYVHDILASTFSLGAPFDAAYAIDVLEHIEPHYEVQFIGNILAGLGPQGVLIIGVPSKESQQYASDFSRAHHVNCKSGNELKSFLECWFHNVFLFSMNDEVIHTGFAPMAHYLFAVCATRKSL